MSERVLDGLLKRRDDLQREISELERLIAFYQDQEERSRSLLLRKKSSISSEKKQILTKNKGLPAKVASAALSLITRVNRPMTRGEIAERLIKNGMALPLTDPAKYVGTILWRNEKIFVNIEGEGYWIRGKRRL